MCGIFGYLGDQDPLHLCLRGLSILEYRGYDSTGICGVQEGEFFLRKKMGTLSELRKILPASIPCNVMIAHTRWATHGKVSDANAHPHLDATQTLAIAHNGIFENYQEWKEILEKEGVQLHSETDTEVLANLLYRNYRGDLVEAMQKTVPLIDGIFALVAIDRNHPNQIVCVAEGCPLSIGWKDKESWVASDPNALQGDNLSVLFLQNREIAKVEKGNVTVYGKDGLICHKKVLHLASSLPPPSREGYSHFLLKEIFEQPRIVRQILASRLLDGEVLFPELDSVPVDTLQQAWLLGCGTSFHAGCLGERYLEEWALLPSQALIASEARYRPCVGLPHTLAIAISQSGETADTLAVFRSLLEKEATTLALCNAPNSTMLREAAHGILLEAGPEMSVCSTKAFVAEVLFLFLLSLYLGKRRGAISLEVEKLSLATLHTLPRHIEEVLERGDEIETLAKRYGGAENFFFLGRRYMYPTALEAALKLQEIAYVHAEGRPSGELKHGPMALLSPQFPILAFCQDRLTESKMASNILEAKARGAPVLAIGLSPNLSSIADDVFPLSPIVDPLAPIPSVVFGQLFAYFVAKLRGCPIDQPRNLAKSVTVE